MKKLIITMLLFVTCFVASSQVTIKFSSGDIYLSRTKFTKDSLYKMYMDESNRLVSRLVTQIGKARIKKVDGYYVKPDGSYTIDERYPIIWYKVGYNRKMTFEVNQAMVRKTYSVKQPFRPNTSQDDFKQWLLDRYK